MEKVTKRFFSDAGHGWLSVKMVELDELNIRDKITAYSYLNGKSAYLEEDVDMSIYIKAMEAKGFEVELDVRDHGNRSRIRRYEPFPSTVVDDDDVGSTVEETLSEETETVKAEEVSDETSVTENVIPFQDDLTLYDVTEEVEAAFETYEAIREEEIAA